MRFPLVVLAAILTASCTPPKVDLINSTGLPDLSPASKTPKHALALDASARYCIASRRCSNTPVLMLVKGPVETVGTKKQEVSAYLLAGRTVYDGRLKPNGPKYLGYRDLDGNPVCQGYYSWSGFGTTSTVELRCFEQSTFVKGMIRSIGRQPTGPYKGKGMGTGLLSFKGGEIAVIYGIDPSDLKALSFAQLWQKHGGDESELPLTKIPEYIQTPPVLNGGKAATIRGVESQS